LMRHFQNPFQKGTQTQGDCHPIKFCLSCTKLFVKDSPGFTTNDCMSELFAFQEGYLSYSFQHFDGLKSIHF